MKRNVITLSICNFQQMKQEFGKETSNTTPIWVMPVKDIITKVGAVTAGCSGSRRILLDYYRQVVC